MVKIHPIFQLVFAKIFWEMELRFAISCMYIYFYAQFIVKLLPQGYLKFCQEMVTEASTYLFHATKRRIYFRNVSILIPVTWKSKSEYLMSKQESYEQVGYFI